MAILVHTKTVAIIQGITGREGMRALEGMRAYGTKVVAGVTPGKGGQNAKGVPVYNTVREAVRRHPAINASLIVVPPAAVKNAALEAIYQRISLVVILTEHVPVRDTAFVLAFARKRSVRVVGPSSIGIISPGKGKIGSIGGSDPKQIFQPGPIGVISKSGGMTAEIAVTLWRHKLGQSTVLGIGGDYIIGSDFVDIVKLFGTDPKTRALVIFGEVGGTYEEQLAEFLQKEKFKKPIIALVAGKFTAALPVGTTLGHAGAIVMKGRGGYDSKVRMLEQAGVVVARTLDDVPLLLKKQLKHI